MTQTSPKTAAPALTRGMKILELLASQDTPQRLTQISEHLGIAMSTAHTLCGALVEAGYVEKSDQNTYQLSLKILGLARSKIATYDIVPHFYDLCDQLPVIRQNGATLSVLDGPDVCFIAARNNPQPLGVTYRPGMTLPACCTASGRAMLAACSDDDVCTLYPEDLPQVTSANLKSRADLLKVLQQVRENGYSDEIAGTRPHMHSYGAAVTTSLGRTIAGVAIVMYDGDVTPKAETEAIAAVQTLGHRLSAFADFVI
ncbi:IclR family transcriptional regulator [Epibacterium ulvae]|uniref:Transcriptional regulator, IclR family n=1 Tax=Epibacterium ulvae TaxID=1156985 RepID=A0A1G5QU80_9RHOB|nr:IclR family transcriptional regulator [Epibacterium ulvae]SCZ64629.1 transcriptional regulator, IclR family [Epibacterium ulvae]